MSGYFKGIKLCGKVKKVDCFPDIRVQVVDSFPDNQFIKSFYYLFVLTL